MRQISHCPERDREPRGINGFTSCRAAGAELAAYTGNQMLPVLLF